MSEIDIGQSVVFGDFSTDEVQVLLDAKDSAVKFSDSPSSKAPTTVTETRNISHTQTRSISPEFQFTSQSLSDYAHSYQFGSSAPSSNTTMASSQNGRSSAKLNVFAKEFVPTVSVPSHLSIISKNEGIMNAGGGYHMPPIIPTPFIIPPPPYGHPVMFIDPTRFPTIHNSSLRGTGGGPQVAIVAPYRTTNEPRPIMVVPSEKYCTTVDSEREEEGESTAGHTKSLSLSPPPSPSPPTLNRRSSSTNDIRTIDITTETTPTNKETTPMNKETTPTNKETTSTNKDTTDMETTPTNKENTNKETTPTKKETTPTREESTPITETETTPTKEDTTLTDNHVKHSSRHTTPTKKETTPTKRETTPTNIETTPTDHGIEQSNVHQSQESPSPPPLSPSSPSPPLSPSTAGLPNDSSISDNVTTPTDLIPINAHSNDQNTSKQTDKDSQKTPNNNNSDDTTSDKLTKKPSPPSIRSWAAVVGTASLAPPPPPPTRLTNEVKTNNKVGVVEITKEERSKVEELKQERLQFIGGQIEGKPLNHTPASILPRGLINNSNLCYIHATLQALISCPELTNLLRSLQLPKMPPNDASSLVTIVTENMVRFIGKFQTYPVRPIVYDANGRRKKAQKDFSYERPFRPDFIYEILPRIKSQLSVQGRQEDAEEFLGCFLNKFHEELVAARQSVATPTEVAMETTPEVKSAESEEEEEWQEVGPKNKSTITRQTDYMESPISQIFGGRVHTCLHRQGTKMSATVEPFFSLQLDIQPECVKSVKDALDLMASKETINLSEKDGNGTRRTTLIHLPHVLILHLKRFIFDGVKSHKLHKSINYDHELEIPKDLLAPSVKGKLTTSQRTYKLWAVVYHCGETPNGGHYICEAYHHQYGGWLRYDDNYVKPTNSEQLFRLSYKVPYLFFYRQIDRT